MEASTSDWSENTHMLLSVPIVYLAFIDVKIRPSFPWSSFGTDASTAPSSYAFCILFRCTLISCNALERGNHLQLGVCLDVLSVRWHYLVLNVLVSDPHTHNRFVTGSFVTLIPSHTRQSNNKRRMTFFSPIVSTTSSPSRIVACRGTISVGDLLEWCGNRMLVV